MGIFRDIGAPDIENKIDKNDENDKNEENKNS